ncbi:MAG: hypothetical protein J7518_03870 [Nocardioidaceae bacterium]|nr:hypothetical protein [Nocardioidaceae bacterium]
MSSLALSYGGLLYLDRTLPLYLDQVRPAGIDLTYVPFDSPGDLFRRQCQYAQFEVSELSASSYLAMLSRGDDRFVALPLPVSRNFRHSQVYVHTDAGIARPEDLRGRRVGILEYQMTAALWIRGFLADDHGVTPDQVDWHTGGLVEPAWAERLELDLPEGVRLTPIPAGATLEAMLEAGELDALVTVQPPQRFGQVPQLRRLFEDATAVERDYHRRTGIFPIMHLVVVRRDVYERHRWVALALYEAFARAKAQGMGRLRAITGLAVGLPFLAAALAEVDEAFAGDAFPYGVEPNRLTLQKLSDYAFEQGIAARRVPVEEMFAPETYQEPIAL